MQTYNAAAPYVLSNLRQINSDLATAQTRIGTGKKVNSAADNGAIWKIAATLKSEIKAQDGFDTNISVAKSKADTAIAALNSAVTLLGYVREASQAAATTNTTEGYAAAYSKINSLKTQITATLNAAVSNGENWATGAAASAVTIGLDSANAAITVASPAADQSTVAVTGLPAAAGDIDALAEATGVSTAVDTAVAALGSQIGALQSFSKGMGAQQDFLKSLKAVKEASLSDLVDADLTEESAKVTALQTQQQLAYQALSISNSSASSILRLFQ